MADVEKIIHLAVEFLKEGKDFNQFSENKEVALVSDDELRKIWNDAWFSVGMTKKVNQIVMTATNYNRAAEYFRRMEMIEPQDTKWGEFADAMDDVISTYVQIVRCKDCKFYNTLMGYCKDGMSYPSPDWFCADGERKE